MEKIENIEEIRLGEYYLNKKAGKTIKCVEKNIDGKATLEVRANFSHVGAYPFRYGNIHEYYHREGQSLMEVKMKKPLEDGYRYYNKYFEDVKIVNSKDLELGKLYRDGIRKEDGEDCIVFECVGNYDAKAVFVTNDNKIVGTTNRTFEFENLHRAQSDKK